MSKRKTANYLLQKNYDSYRVMLFNYCLSRLEGSREAADDCVQETFIVFYSKLLEGEHFDNPRAFLYRTADNFVKRQKQKDAMELRREIPLDDALNIGVYDEEYFTKLDKIDYEKCASELLSLLSEEEKNVYELRYVQNLKVEDIALMLGISRPATSMRLMRLRNKIIQMVYSLDLEEKGG